MQNRRSKYPGRVKLIPVAGQKNTYDLIRADQPIEKGTAISKENLLSDATAERLGLGQDATVNDALRVLADEGKKLPAPEDIGAAAAEHTHTAEEIGAAAAEHTHTAEEIGAAKIETGSYVGTGEGTKSLTFSYKPKFVMIKHDTNVAGGTQAFIIDKSPVMTVLCSHQSDGFKMIRTPIVWDGNSFTVTSDASTSSAAYAMNVSTVSYSYVAIG